MANARPLILIMAGGTGGHVYPALAVALELLHRGCQVQWLGTGRGLESQVVPAAGIELNQISARGLRGKRGLVKLLGLAELLLAQLQCVWLLLRLRPTCVLGFGGYVSGPGGLAAWLLRRPLLIHEQNAVAGTTNRLLAPLARRILTGFPLALGATAKVRYSGNPVRRELLLAAAQSVYDYRCGAPLKLLVLGGSLGAKPLNDLMPLLLSRLRQQGQVELWHQCGEAHAVAVARLYAAAGLKDCRVDAFVEDMAAAYSWADLVVCRAGALTIAELAIMGRPAILVPLPHAIDDHQSHNAQYLADAGAAWVLRQADMSVASLGANIETLMATPDALQKMAAAARRAALPGATQTVVDSALEVCHGR